MQLVFFKSFGSGEPTQDWNKKGNCCWWVTGCMQESWQTSRLQMWCLCSASCLNFNSQYPTLTGMDCSCVHIYSTVICCSPEYTRFLCLNEWLPLRRSFMTKVWEQTRQETSHCIANFNHHWNHSRTLLCCEYTELHPQTLSSFHMLLASVWHCGLCFTAL